MTLKRKEVSHKTNDDLWNRKQVQNNIIDLQDAHRESIENLPVLDAFRDHLSWRGLLNSGYIPQRFYMQKSGRSIECVNSLCQNYYKKNIVITAPAGYGKTTALLMVYLNGEALSNQRYYYISASAFVVNANELDEYEYAIRRAIEKKQLLDGVILLDGLEEAYGKNYTSAGELIKQIVFEKNYVWIACRPDFYTKITSQLEGKFMDVAKLDEWNNNDFELF